MINFLSFLSPRFLKGLAIVAVIAAIGGAIYFHFQSIQAKDDRIAELVSEKATLEANVAQLEEGITKQQETIASLQEDFRLQAEILNSTNEQFQDARDNVTRLRDRLGSHELGFLAYNRPGLVENIINDATDEVGRCFEIAAGAPLTEEELNATLPSQINSECPDLANPNYEE